MAKFLNRIIQISDCHLFANTEQTLLSVNTYESLTTITQSIQMLHPKAECIIASGDISQDDSKKSYEHFIALTKKLNVPVYAVPGNHDDILMMKNLFPQKQLILKSWQIILLNSQKSKFVEGYLDSEELDFLEMALASHPELSCIIFFHHYPVKIGSQWLDNIGLSNKEKFWKCINTFSNVKAVFFGHAHQEFVGKMHEIPCYGAPSTCFQFKKNHATFALENIPPGFRWIDLYDDGTLKTDVQRIKHYIGVFEKDATGYE